MSDGTGHLRAFPAHSLQSCAHRRPLRQVIAMKDSCVHTNIDFSGLWIPIVTPLRGGRVDHDDLARLVKRLAATGIAGFMVCATKGEAPLLDDDERGAVLATVT